jgi:hypothetical protein
MPLNGEYEPSWNDRTRSNERATGLIKGEQQDENSAG